MAKDLVCNMEVDPKTAAAKAEYMGKTYCFCSPGCKAAFDRDPGTYIQAEAHEGGSAQHNHAH